MGGKALVGKKKKCTGKINSKFYHLSLLMYILFSNLTTCGFILPKEYILEGNKSISYLLFYKDKVSLFSLYQSHHGSWSHILILLFLFKRQQAKHNVFHEHTDHSQNWIMIDDKITQDLNKHSLSARKCQPHFQRAKCHWTQARIFHFM